MINNILSSTAPLYPKQQNTTTIQNQDYATNYVTQTPHIQEVNKPIEKGSQLSAKADKQPTFLDKDKSLFLKEFSNNISLLSQTSKKLSQVKTSDSVERATKDFVNQFNKTVDFLEEHKDNNKTLDNFYRSLVDQGERAESSLESIGITRDEEGKLQIDEEKFSALVEESPEKVKEAMEGIAENTQAFATRASFTSTEALIKDNKVSDKFAKYEEAYKEAAHMIARNSQFMRYQMSAEATGKMIDALI